MQRAANGRATRASDFSPIPREENPPRLSFLFLSLSSKSSESTYFKAFSDARSLERETSEIRPRVIDTSMCPTYTPEDICSSMRDKGGRVIASIAG